MYKLNTLCLSNQFDGGAPRRLRFRKQQGKSTFMTALSIYPHHLPEKATSEMEGEKEKEHDDATNNLKE